ncbi:hypothetical protein NE237_002251 [Protea cynaroides]|uniref:Uncharacterized protein n=1 Tax=Protea cynaroides TaxID=273540 RepID=A0A9Q0QZA2_9MAGN|nr:hypothetical protein NE237_002251 [Protea cynaroides]
METIFSANVSTTLHPSLPSDDIEMQTPSLGYNSTTNLNRTNLNSAFSSETTNYISLARMDIGVWLAAATPLLVLYYQERSHVSSTLRVTLFAFMLASLFYVVGIFLQQKFSSTAQVMIQVGVVLAAISFFMSMGLMLL